MQSLPVPATYTKVISCQVLQASGKVPTAHETSIITCLSPDNTLHSSGRVPPSAAPESDLRGHIQMMISSVRLKGGGATADYNVCLH